MTRCDVTRRSLLGAAAAAAAALPARAQGDFPSRPVRLISGFAPGGGTDILGRLIARKFGDLWPPGMVVENRSGASGVVGATYVGRAPADGYTLLLMPNSQTITQHVQRNTGFDVQRDLTPIGMIATSPLVLSVHASLPVRSVAELVAHERANRGRLNHGSAGTATAPHLAGELFNIMAGTRIEHVPYRGSGPAVTAHVANEVGVSFSPLNSIEGFVREGQLRVLAVLGAARFAGLPEVPTMAESGFPGYAVDLWYAMLGPAGLPAPIVQRLNADLNRVITDAETARAMTQRGFIPAPGPAEALARVIAADLDRWKTVTERADIRLD